MSGRVSTKDSVTVSPPHKCLISIGSIIDAMGFTIYRKLVIWFVLVSLLSLGLATAIGILLALVIAGVLARSISAPISELAHTAGAIADGDLTKRVNTGRDDEIGELAVTFNRMADVLKENTDAIEEKTLELERVNAELKELDRLKSEFISIIEAVEYRERELIAHIPGG
jgi:HAMP domain-containing protein